MRIAFIGVGGIAQNYLRSLDRLGEQVVAVCDVDEQRARTVAEARGARMYVDHHDMFEREAFEAVFVCVPPFAHTDQELLAAEKGIGLFVAKPVALTLEKVREVSAAIQAADIVNQVGYMWRYSDLVDQARELQGGRPLGLVLGFALTSLPGTAWWRVRGKSGTQIVEQTTHIFDLARYFAGEVASVSALGRRALMTEVADLDFEDVSAVNLTFDSGAIGNISSTSAIRGGRYALELIARDCHLNLDFTAGKLTGTVAGEKVNFAASNNPYFDQVQVFVHACRTGDTSRIRSTYADAARTLAVTVAAVESIASGRMESVPSL